MNDKAKKIPTMSKLDSFPDSAHVRIPEVKVLLGVSNATIWRMVAVGKLKRYKLTERTAVFNLGELRTFISENKE